MLPYNITLAGNDGDDAQRYQEKDVRNVQEVKQPGGEDDTTL
ncbi:hypothetical protein [Gloeocapsopsis sp. IPPAS B-1203]|nr:hypothetical protein [Gloeocapsopsis sp. IPPAS B-1203]